ncbi:MULTISPECIES: DUF5518 domain-containing protein [Haloferax]|uniref:DUF5518 domain-containing protein n=1 Tax=Haloferax marinum TaxID=2666143 RepID=A0A6A8G8V4_9EURY|nr:MULTISPECIES: DUF5518 domain-containing protein [Haloferax]KAB1198493.1 hypothetical protein Hfx1150_13605 [Haloferax sp. CBA1150]MRW97599.1 hypothetical protein [Haloferax marinum]
MAINWRAVLYGFGTSIVLGLLSGFVIPFTDFALPVIGAGLAGLIAGGVAGYYNNRSTMSDATHGALATVIGALIVGILFTVLGTLLAGIFGLGAGLGLLVLIFVAGIPGAVGGVVGGYLHRGREDRMGRPTA